MRAGCGPGGRRATPPAQPVAARSPPRRRAQTPMPTPRARIDALADLKAKGQEHGARQPGELGQALWKLAYGYSRLHGSGTSGLRVGCELLDIEDIVTVQKLAGPRAQPRATRAICDLCWIRAGLRAKRTSTRPQPPPTGLPQQIADSRQQDPPASLDPRPHLAYHRAPPLITQESHGHRNRSAAPRHPRPH